MSKKKIIAVVGSTGAQGSGLVKAILNDKNSEFSVRALSRNVNSEKASELMRLGAELVTADIDDKASLTQAFKGAYAAYCVTFFWEYFSPEKEIQQAKNMADAAKAAGVQHVIWSTLEDTREWIPLSDDRMPTLMEKYKVPHFDCKGEVDSYFLNLGIPVTLLRTSFYWDNFIHFGMGPQKDEEGNYKLTFPMADKKLPGIASEDIGKSAYGIFKRGHEFQGKTVGIAGEHLTGKEMASAMSEVMGTNIEYNPIDANIFRNLGFPGAEDLGNMFQFKAEFETAFCTNRNLEFSREINPELKTFKQWLLKNKENIVLD